MKPTAARLVQKEIMQQKKHRMRMMTPGPPTAAYETYNTESLSHSLYSSRANFAATLNA